MSRDALLEALGAAEAAVPRILELATQEERAAVVAWLRSWDGLSDWPRTLAASIERGEHRREEK